MELNRNENADEGEHEQDDRAEERPGGDEGTAAAPAGMPGPVADRPDQWLDEQTGDGSGEVEDREFVGRRPDQQEKRFTADWVRPKLNCTPKNPRFIISRALPDINGLCSTCVVSVETDSGFVVVMAAPEPQRCRSHGAGKANSATSASQHGVHSVRSSRRVP